MRFLKKLFGGAAKSESSKISAKAAAPAVINQGDTDPPPRVAPASISPAKETTQPTPARAARPPAGGGLDLPPEFDGKMSYRDMFQTLPPEQLRVMCHALPIELLDLENPGRPAIAVKMGRAISHVFGVSTYIATKYVPAEFGDIVLPRLVGKICEYDGSDLHIELCDLVRDFAIHLAGGGRHQEAVSVARVLKNSSFWHAWSQGDVLLFFSLQKIAIQTNLRSDFEAALEAAQHVPASQKIEGFDNVVSELKRKMEGVEDIRRNRSDEGALFPNVPNGVYTRDLAAENYTSYEHAIAEISMRAQRGDRTGLDEMEALLRCNCSSGSVEFHRPSRAGLIPNPGDRIEAGRAVLRLAHERGLLSDPRSAQFWIMQMQWGNDMSMLQEVLGEIRARCGEREARILELLYSHLRITARYIGATGG